MSTDDRTVGPAASRARQHAGAVQTFAELARALPADDETLFEGFVGAWCTANDVDRRGTQAQDALDVLVETGGRERVAAVRLVRAISVEPGLQERLSWYGERLPFVRGGWRFSELVERLLDHRRLLPQFSLLDDPDPVSRDVSSLEDVLCVVRRELGKPTLAAPQDPVCELGVEMRARDFRALLEQAVVAPSFGGARVVVMPPDRRLPPAPWQPWQYAHAHLALQAQIDGRLVRANVWCRLGPIERSQSSLGAPWVQEAALPVVTVDHDLTAPVHTGSRPLVADVPQPTLQLRTVEEFAGPDSCTHAGARWQLVGVGHAFGTESHPDAARLACGVCRRERLAFEPRHRLRDVEQVALSAADEEWYLQREQAYAHLRGEVPPTSFSDLVARDGIAPSDPSEYEVTRGVVRVPGGAYAEPAPDAETVAAYHARLA